MNLLTFLLFANLSYLASCSEVIRPRGVSLSKKIFYDPSKDFTCIDGSLTIPFKQVNDDYCDCLDGSDEPGTSACPNGSFHCTNVGFFEKDIYSSMVNDGICDCCDGSDEWLSNVNCANNCLELGELSREEFRKQQEILRQGNEIREGYIKEANEKKLNIDKQLNQYKQELNLIEKEKDERLQLKEQTDHDEREALDKHNAKLEELKREFDEQQAKKTKEEDDRLAMSVFKELDVNEDGQVHYTELIKFGKFDQNSDGLVSDDEAKVVLNSQESMSLDEFLSAGWALIKPFYLVDKTTKEQHEDTNQDLNQENTQIETEEDLETIENNHEANQGEDYQDENGYDETAKDDYATKQESSAQPPELEYDEETKQLMEKAKVNRDEYSSIEQRFLTIQNKIQELENSLKYDYGQEDEFLPLHGQCFEYTDREYTYKLCPFDIATQRPKDGAGETNLGRWGHWTGSDNKKYSSFKMDAGSQCWNGPMRTVNVLLSCGVENKVTSATEPSRCEYQFEFETPARCILKSSDRTHQHTEL